MKTIFFREMTSTEFRLMLRDELKHILKYHMVIKDRKPIKKPKVLAE